MPKPPKDLLDRIKARRERLKRQGKLRKRPAKWLHPDATERDYTRRLIALSKTIETQTERILLSQLEILLNEAEANRSDGSEESRARRLLDALTLSLDKQFKASETLAKGMTGKVNRWNKTQWLKILRSVIGVDVIATEPWLTPLLAEKVKENVALIKSIKDRAVTEIEELTLEGIRTGRRHESLQKDIRRRFDVSASRAELIARDQVTKLNGDLTRERQRGMGLKRYTWRTSRDERVRESHRIKEGKEFDWTKPPVDTGHPGQDIQCRCTAEPIFDELEAMLR